MTSQDTHEISILLARIDERLANVQEDIAEINGSRHCSEHGTRMTQIEKVQGSINAKWWAALIMIVAGWLKMLFLPGAIK